MAVNADFGFNDNLPADIPRAAARARVPHRHLQPAVIWKPYDGGDAARGKIPDRFGGVNYGYNFYGPNRMMGIGDRELWINRNTLIPTGNPNAASSTCWRLRQFYTPPALWPDLRFIALAPYFCRLIVLSQRHTKGANMVFCDTMSIRQERQWLQKI